MFDVKKHLIRVQGGREYLPVAYRLVWFREEHPTWGIATEPIVCDVEKGVFVWHARITDETGRVLAEGTKQETVRGFADACEKAETGAIGRALGVLGYGTQFAPEFDEGERLADSPLPIGNQSPRNGRHVKPAVGGNGASVANIGRDFVTCEVCGRPLTRGQQELSHKKHGRPLCPAHQAESASL